MEENTVISETLDLDRVPALDGLRGLACLAVFGVHFQQKTGIEGTLWQFDLARLMQNGNTAVGFFFLLSGFLLALPCWSRAEHNNEGGGGGSWRRYFWRRFGRIAPAYYLALSALVVKNEILESVQGMKDFLVVHRTHTFMMRSREVLLQVDHFLKTGAFKK